MKNQKWYEKPVTWGGYLKLCGVCYALSLLCGAAWMIAYYWEELRHLTVRDLICYLKGDDKEE